MNGGQYLYKTDRDHMNVHFGVIDYIPFTCEYILLDKMIAIRSLTHHVKMGCQVPWPTFSHLTEKQTGLQCISF